MTNALRPLLMLLVVLPLWGCPNAGGELADDDDTVLTDDDDTAEPDDDDATTDDDDATTDDDDATTDDDDATTDDDDATTDDDDATTDDDDATTDDDDATTDDDDATTDDDDATTDDDDATTDDDDATTDDDDATTDDDDDATTDDDDDATDDDDVTGDDDDDDATGDDDDSAIDLNSPPDAVDDAYDFAGNATLTIDATLGLLANDSDPDGEDPFVDTASSPITTTQGGTATLSANGSFTYEPPAAIVAGGVDTFDYTIADPAGDTDTATVTLTADTVIWFVDNLASSGDGTLLAPFPTLAAAEAAADEGETIFVFAGDGTTIGQAATISLQEGQTLWGEGVALTLGAIELVPAGAAPVITSVSGSAVLAQGSATVRGLTIEAPLADGISANDGDLLVEDVTVTDAGATGVVMEAGSSLTVIRTTIQGADDGGVRTEGIASVSLDDVTITGNDSYGVELNETTSSITIDDSTISNSTDTSDLLRIYDDEFGETLTVSIEGSTMQGNGVDLNGAEDAFDIYLDGDGSGDGTIDLLIDDCTFGFASSDGIELDFESDVGQTVPSTVTITNNTVSDFGSDGIDLDFIDDAQATVIVSSNTVTGHDTLDGSAMSNDVGIELRASNDAAATITMDNNTAQAMDWVCIEVIAGEDGGNSDDPAQLTLTAAGNNTTGGDSNAFALRSFNEATLTATVSGGTLTGAGDDGMVVEADDESTLVLMLTGTTVTNSGDDSFFFSSADEAELSATFNGCSASGNNDGVLARNEDDADLQFFALNNTIEHDFELDSQSDEPIELAGPNQVGVLLTDDDGGNLAANSNTSITSGPLADVDGDVLIIAPGDVEVP